MKRGKNYWAAAVCLLCCLLLGACGKNRAGTGSVFLRGPGADEVFKIGSEACKKEELVIYLTTIQNQYESVYGSEIWNASLDGVTLEENIKEMVLAQLAQVKTMYLLAKERGTELSEEEEKRVQEASAEYFNSLSDTEKEAIGADQDTILKMYREYALADKVYRQIIQDVNPEISDDEARKITVQQIVLYKTSDHNKTSADAGNPANDDTAALIYEKAQEARNKAIAEGGQDFEELAVQYSDEPTITISFGKGEKAKALEDAAFLLETGQVSDIIDTGDTYTILKCISTFNREETDANKVRIAEERKKEAFGEVYDAFVGTLKRQLNESLWQQVELIHNGQVTTKNFFEIYAKFFP